MISIKIIIVQERISTRAYRPRSRELRIRLKTQRKSCRFKNVFEINKIVFLHPPNYN